MNLITTFPRSTAFRTEQEFLLKLRSWKAEVKKATRAAEELYAEAEEDDEVLGWWSSHLAPLFIFR